jgi:hypothetical protein
MSKYNVRGVGWSEDPPRTKSDNYGMFSAVLHDMVGFRVVFDASHRRDRGSSWHEQPAHASVPDADDLHPTAKHEAQGFRLAKGGA